MLLAYIDEIGEPGAFVAPDHRRFHTSPAFGYAGFIIPEHEARAFGARFTTEKRNRFLTEIEKSSDPGQFEVKGADFFRGNIPQVRPENLRIFSSLVADLCRRGGRLFYYADEKPLGTPKQTNFSPEEREFAAMQETLNRIARHANFNSENVLVTIDSINEKTRAERVAKMYQHIFSRSSEYPEMRRLIEPPMHLDSKLSSNIQFADWVAGYLTRAIDRQLLRESKYLWVGEEYHSRERISGSFTYESKLHLHNRSIEDLNHSTIIYKERPLHVVAQGQKVGDSVHADTVRRMRAAAEKNQK